MALLLPFVEKGDHRIDIAVDPAVLVDMEAHLRQADQDLRLAPRTAGRVECVHEGVKAAPGGDARVELPHRSGSGIARVREERLALSRELGVQSLKTALRHVHLAPDLERRCELRRDRHRKRNAGNGLDVGRDVFTDIPVAPGGSDAVAADLIEEAHGQAIDLQLGDVLELDVSQRSTHALVEFANLLTLEGVGQAQHRCAVSDPGEGVGGRTPHSLCRRVRRDQLRVLRLQLDQLAEERVVLRVGDLGMVEHVVLPVGSIDQTAQLQDARLRLLPARRPPRAARNVRGERLRRLDGLVHTLTIGARLTARIFMPTLSNLTMISSSVLVMVLLSTEPRPQARCSTWSPGAKRWTSSTGAAGRAASTRRAGAMLGSGMPAGKPAEPSTRSRGVALRKREGRFRLALPQRWRRKA